MHYIIVNNSLVNTFKSKGETRALCKVNNQLKFHCAFMPKKEGGYYVNIGTRICKKLNLKEGNMLRAIFTVDVSPHQFEMPEELREVLAVDSDARQVFISLTQRKQRGLMYLITQVK